LDYCGSNRFGFGDKPGCGGDEEEPPVTDAPVAPSTVAPEEPEEPVKKCCNKKLIHCLACKEDLDAGDYCELGNVKCTKKMVRKEKRRQRKIAKRNKNKKSGLRALGANGCSALQMSFDKQGNAFWNVKVDDVEGAALAVYDQENNLIGCGEV